MDRLLHLAGQQKRLLKLAQGVWWFIFATMFCIFGFNVLEMVVDFGKNCKSITLCGTGQLPTSAITQLNGLHIPVSAVLVALGVFSFSVGFLYWLFGMVIFWKKRDVAGIIVSTPLIIMAGLCLGFFSPLNPVLQWAVNLCWTVLPIFLVLLCYTFPNGRFQPGWVFAPAAGILVIEILFTNAPLGLLANSVLVLGALANQVYRYKRKYSPIEKQQMKVFIYAFLLFAVCLIVNFIFGSHTNVLVILGLQIVFEIGWGILLLGIGVPILRYRLWDIDILINRTLVYGALTVTLGGIYVSLIFGLQALLRNIISQNNSVAIVVSTLAIAALFQPLRHRIQRIIDRRFYRNKYDAAKIVAQFSKTLQDELDLEQLREHLLNVVQETMQPAHVTLWLKPSSTIRNNPLKSKDEEREVDQNTT